MSAILLSYYEKHTIRIGVFPSHNLPSEEEEKQFSNHIISGNYSQNTHNGKLGKEELLLDLKNTKEKWYFLLYGQKYHYFKIKEFVVLDPHGMDNHMYVKYMALASMSEETRKIFTLNSYKNTDRLAFSQFREDQLNYKNHLVNRDGVYFISHFLHLKKQDKTITKDNWKHSAYLDHILFSSK